MLIIDHIEPVLFYFADMRNSTQRWNITSVLTGEEAVEYLRTQSFDLVVVDKQLGDGISGIEVGRFVRYNLFPVLSNCLCLVLTNKSACLSPSM